MSMSSGSAHLSHAIRVNSRTRNKTLGAFTLTKISGAKTGRKVTDPFAGDKARLLFEHPHSYRDWNIVGVSGVPGFHHLESTVRLGFDFYQQRMVTTRFELCLHETEFTRIR